jgi:hypothetical protein
MNLKDRMGESFKQVERDVRKELEKRNVDWRHLREERTEFVSRLQRGYGQVQANANRTVEAWRRKLNL